MLKKTTTTEMKPTSSEEACSECEEKIVGTWFLTEGGLKVCSKCKLKANRDQTHESESIVQNPT